MSSQSSKPLPLPVKRALKKLGADLADARKRRRISTSTMAQRAMIGRTVIATVMFILGMNDRLALVSNVDDHLRNHGFLYDTGKRGWRLSPAYDLNPVPVDIKPRILSLMIDDRDNSASFDLTVEVGDYFGLVEDDMRAVVTDLVNSISTWKDEARRIGISVEEINRMATAFEHDEMRRAQRFCAA